MELKTVDLVYYLIFISVSQEFRDKHKVLSNGFINLQWTYSSEKDEYNALYAYTTDKKILKEFKRTRDMSLFTIYKLGFNVLEQDKNAVNINESMKLDYFLYKSGPKGEETAILSNENEHEICETLPHLIEMNIKNPYLPDPQLINIDLLKVLEMISYSFHFYSYVIEAPSNLENNLDNFNPQAELLAERYDVFWNNYRFAYNGKYMNEYNQEGRSVTVNELMAFINTFGMLFK